MTHPIVIKLPKNVRHHVRLAEHQGHELVSQGCSLFRCVRCNGVAFLDNYGGGMDKGCSNPMTLRDFKPSQFR